MPFALLFIGMGLIVTGFQNTYQQAGALVAGDFTGKNNFIYWIATIGTIGSLGYIKDLQGMSRAFMVLILIAYTIGVYKNNPNFFKQFQSSLGTGTANADTTIGAALPANSSGGSAGSSGSSGSSISGLESIASFASTAASIFG